jgi:penicillin amidase
MAAAIKIALRVVLLALGAIVLVVAIYAGNVTAGMHAAASTEGTLSGLGVIAPVQILRDGRDVPHIRAKNEHDMFFAQGYVEGSDRLFQLDLQRRFVYGTLAEVLGKALLLTDEKSRQVPVAQIVDREWMALPARQRATLQAFADGVNASMHTQPTPVEFRMLLYHPQPWNAKDSLAVGFATVLDLTDTWNDIAPRDVAWKAGRFDSVSPLSDPCYDAPLADGLTAIRTTSSRCVSSLRSFLDRRPPIGSNEWAAGAAHTMTGRALLANDPHLSLSIPGVWYLVDLQSPGYHAAGATLAGAPGVVLGHNDHVAWAATNGTVASMSVFEAAPDTLRDSGWQNETFRVRFGGVVTQRYYRIAGLFGVTLRDKRVVLVRWDAYNNPASPLGTFDGLDRATSMESAVAALSAYPGPTQNFALADTSGRVAYYLAGSIPNDPAWARYIHPAADLTHAYSPIPFAALPHTNASRDAIVWTSNNKMYGAGYAYRLSPQFAPPYRAYRVAQLLKARAKYDVRYFAKMQMDTFSPGEYELAQRARTHRAADARFAASLRRWNGLVSPDSVGAAQAVALRKALVAQGFGFMGAMVRRRREVDSFGSLDVAISAAMANDPHDATWGTFGAVTVEHPLAALGAGFLNGTRFSGDGDAYTVHVQNNGFSQSFHAVWDVGNWDAGGITIPQGESGEPGSGFYTDEANAWVNGTLLSLPYSDAAVERAAHARMTLTP